MRSFDHFGLLLKLTDTQKCVWISIYYWYTNIGRS